MSFYMTFCQMIRAVFCILDEESTLYDVLISVCRLLQENKGVQTHQLIILNF